MPEAQRDVSGVPAAILPPNGLTTGSSLKIGVLQNADSLLLFSRKAGGGTKGGLQKQMAKNKNSLGGSINTVPDPLGQVQPQERWGISLVQNLVGMAACAYRRVPTRIGVATSASAALGAGPTGWTDQNIGVSTVVPGSVAGTAPIARLTTLANDCLEWDETIPPEAKCRVAFLASSGGAEVEISVGAKIVWQENLTGTQAGRLIIAEFSVMPGARTIRVRHTGNGTGVKALYIFGINFVSLDHPVTRGAGLDTFASFRDNNAYSVQGESENWYAVQDRDANLIGGGFHGEKRRKADKIVIDGVETTPTVGVPFVYQSLVIQQETTIDFRPHGGGYLDVVSVQDLSTDGTLHRRASFSGSARVGMFYTHMMSANTTFSEVVYPTYQTPTGIGKHAVIGRAPEVKLRNPATGQTVTGQFNLHANERGDYTAGTGHIEVRPDDRKHRIGRGDSDSLTTLSITVTQEYSQSSIQWGSG